MSQSQGSPLLAEFLAAAGVRTHAASLDGALGEFLAAARRRWPSFAFEERAFVRHVGACARDGQLPALEHAADLLLAYACSRSLPAAIRAFQGEYAPVIERVLLHRCARADLAAEAHQIVLERLLVGDARRGAAPKIASYRGAGPLQNWVASTAATTLATLGRTETRQRELARAVHTSSALPLPHDPELDYLKRRYKVAVEQALLQALSQLGERNSILLRLSLGERMSIDALGAMYSVNRATAARWLAAARTQLVDTTKRILRARLNLSERECESVVALVQSQIEVSIVDRLYELSA
jgi:RNA polymerase sigma-70 factor, ECF subfamily